MTTSAASGFTVRFRGVRGSLPSPAPGNMRYGGNTSCLEVRCGNQLLILDAGSGLRLLGEELFRAAGSNAVEATLLLSHTHWDHIQGLPFFAPGYSARNRIRILSAPGHATRVQRALANQMSPLHFPVGLDQMRGLGRVAELERESTRLENLVVRTIELNHPGGCTGFRIEGEGCSLGYLPDHEPYRTDLPNAALTVKRAHAELVQFVRGLDLLILDTQYTAEEYTHRLGWGHGCLPDSVQLAMEADVRQLVLFHHDPSHDDQRIDQMLEAARTLASGSQLMVHAATEGEILSVAQSTCGLSTSCPAPSTPVSNPVAA
jgi:phosphoribosyl 1,2-cyclic phosphodiesterase